MLCWRDKAQGSKQESGVSFLVHKSLDKYIVEFHGVSERVASSIMNMIKRLNLKVVQVQPAAIVMRKLRASVKMVT